MREDTITISITIPVENGIVHTHSVILPDDGLEHSAGAEDALKEFLELMKCVWGESAVNNISLKI